MTDNRFECGCERGGDCTKTTMCAVQDMAEEIKQLQECELDLLKRDIKAGERIAELEGALRHVFECDDSYYCPECQAAGQLLGQRDE